MKFTDSQFCQNIPFRFDKAIFQHNAHNRKSLIAMLSHKNTVHIITTKRHLRK